MFRCLFNETSNAVTQVWPFRQRDVDLRGAQVSALISLYGWLLAKTIPGRTVKASQTPQPTPSPKSVKEASKAPDVTEVLEVEAAKPTSKAPEAPKKAPAKPKKVTKPKQATITKPPKPKQVLPPAASRLEEISHILDKPPLDACVQLTRKLLTSDPSLRKAAVLKTVIIFVAEYGNAA